MKRYDLFGIAVSAFILMFGACTKQHTHETPEWKVYVANETSENITVIDAATNDVLKFIDIRDGSGNMRMVHNIQSSPDGKTIWGTVNSMTGAMDKLVVIDPLTDEIVKWIDVGVGMKLGHVVLDSSSTFAYVTSTDSNLVIEVNAHSFVITRRFDLGAGHSPHGLRFSRGRLYVANLDSGTLSVISTADGAISDIPVGGMVVQTAVTVDGQYVFATLYDTKEVIRYETASGGISRFELPGSSVGPVQLYPDPAGTRLFICDQGLLLSRPSSDKLFVMNISTGQIISTIATGDGAHGVVVSNDGLMVYVTNKLNNSVSVVNASDYSIVCEIPVGADPNGITFWTLRGGQP